MKRRQHTRGGEGGGGGGGKNQRQEQPISGISMMTTTTRATNHQKKTSLSASALTNTLVRPLLVECLTYADPDTIRVLCCVSKQFRDLIYNDPQMEHNRVIRLLEIRPSKNNEDDKGRLIRLIVQLYHHRDKLQQYREVRIIDGHKFVYGHNYRYEVEQYATRLQLNGVASLNNSSFTPSGTWHLTNALAMMMPNLREVNVSNCGISQLSKQCCRLEKLSYSNVQPFTFVSANGKDMVHAKNLRELTINNSSFGCIDPTDIEKMSDSDNDEHSTIFLFHKWGSTVLERLSIKNSTWYNGKMTKYTVIPQNALIKFIRNAPASLRYFGSDLSQANIEMLRSEEGGRGSEIEFG